MDPFPVDAGKKVVLAGVLEYLADRFGPENVHYVLLTNDAASDKFPGPVHVIDLPRRGALIRSLLTRTATGRASLQESFLHSRRTGSAIRRVLDTIGADVEIYDTIRMAQYVRKPDSRQVCYLDDLFSERYRAMLLAGEKHQNVEMRPLGNFAKHIPARLRPLADAPKFQRALLRFERKRVAASEDRVARRFARSVLVNPGEAGLLERRSGAQRGRVGAISPLVPDRVTLRKYTGSPSFVFLGLLALPHNDDAIRSFISTTWPLVLERRPDATLTIVGRQAGDLLLKLVAEYPDSITLTGFVPDLGEILSSSAAMVNPLRFGSGIKLKVIESLRAGLPVVSTRVGADGIRVGAEHGVIEVDDAQGTAEALVALCDPAYNEALSTAARKHYVDKYSREAVYADYDRNLIP